MPEIHQEKCFINAAVPLEMKHKLKKIAEERCWSLSDTARDAFREKILSYEQENA